MTRLLTDAEMFFMPELEQMTSLVDLDLPELPCGCSIGWRCKHHAFLHTGRGLRPDPRIEDFVRLDRQVGRDTGNPENRTFTPPLTSTSSGRNRSCQVCQEPLSGRRANARFCSPKCRAKGNR